jgi:DNA adenine methylase
MRYLGGKYRLSGAISRILQAQSPRNYREPFCGMFSVGRRMPCPREAGDNSPDLIALLSAVRDGWVPPDNVTEDEYAYWRDQPPSPMRGFVGFGCSFGGKFFGGFAREATGRNFATNARNSLCRLARDIQGVIFKHQDYTAWPDDADIEYLDPPYAKTTAYSTGNFDSAAFWDWVRSRNSMVYVSEYMAPEDFTVVWEQSTKSTVNGWQGPQKPRTERLFLETKKLGRHKCET